MSEQAIKKTGFDRLESNINKMYAIRFLAYLHFVSAVLIPFFTEWGGIALSRVLWLNAWFMFCIFLFEIPTGSVADFYQPQDIDHPRLRGRRHWAIRSTPLTPT